MFLKDCYQWGQIPYTSSLLFVVCVVWQHIICCLVVTTKAKEGGAFTPCYESQNFSIVGDIRYEQVLGTELAFVLGNLCINRIVSGRPMGKKIKKRNYFY